MLRQMGVRTCTIMLCLGVIMWSGCANFLKPEVGAVARNEARIALVGDIPGGIFQAGDVSFSYSLVQKGETCTLTGKLIFDRSLGNAFPTITNFFFYLTFLDDAGKVIETVDITPVIHTYGAIPDSLSVKMTHTRPPGSKAFAFHYYGNFRAATARDGSSWNIYHFPFE